jgi:hypothetical protein
MRGNAGMVLGSGRGARSRARSEWREALMFTSRFSVGLQGLGDDPCAPGFSGPLTDDQKTICNLQAGITYRDQLLSAPSSSTATCPAGETCSIIGGVPNTYIYIGGGVLGLLFVMMNMGGGRRR